MPRSAPRATLSTEATLALLTRAVGRAGELDVRIHVAVYDGSGEEVGFVSCEGAPPLAATTARHKAFTAVRTGMSTLAWKQYVDSIPADELKIIDKVEGYIAADGGYPVFEGELLLGGVGVSGADQERDADVARAALAALETLD